MQNHSSLLLVPMLFLVIGCSGSELVSEEGQTKTDLLGPSFDRSHVQPPFAVIDLDPTYAGLVDSNYTGQEFTVRCVSTSVPLAHHPFILKFSDSSVVQNLGVVSGSGTERIFKVRSVQSTDTWRSSIIWCGFGDDEGDLPTYSTFTHVVTSTTPPRPVTASYSLPQAQPTIGSTVPLGLSSVSDQRGNPIVSFSNTSASGSYSSLNSSGTISGFGLGMESLTYTLCAQPFHTQLPTQSPCTTFSRVVNVRPLTPTLSASLRAESGYNWANLTWSSQAGVTGYRVWRKCVDNVNAPNANPWEPTVVAGTSLATYDEASSFSDTVPNSPYFMYYVEAISPSGLASAQSSFKYFVGSADPIGC